MSDAILVLDDERSYAEMLRDLLSDHGFTAEISTQPKEALERLHERSYALIVSDFKMPEVDGAQFLVEARRIVPHLPVIMISGMMTTPDLLKVANIGVTLVLEKPFNVEVFLDYVRRFVQPQGAAEASPTESLPAEDEATGAPDRGERAYPPLKYLVDDSLASRHLLQDLWEAINAGQRHLLLLLPPGSEFSEVVRELAAWRGRAGLAPFHFSLQELDRPDVRQTIRELARLDNAAPCIAVSLPDGAALDLDRLLDFVRWEVAEPDLVERFLFVYGLPAARPLERRELADVSDVVAGPLRVEALPDRLVDLAAYMARFLEQLPREDRRSLEPDAASALLQYDWPGNHRELMSVLRRAFNLATDGSVTREHIQAAIRSKHGEMTGGGMQLNLESFLLMEQRRFLRERGGAGADLKTIAELAGIGLDRLQTDKQPDDQPLLFPELLEEEGATTDHHGPGAQ